MRFAKRSNAKKLAEGIAGHFISSLNQCFEFNISPIFRHLQPHNLIMDKPDPDKMTGPGGLTLTQIHTQVKLSTARDQREIAQNKFAPTPTRWQRLIRYARSGKREKT
jgi:hypothetical protein